MKYNPNIHHRRSVRLRGYDYAQEGMYFITICTKNRIHFFGEVENGIMNLNDYGEIAHREWEKIPERWPHMELGAFQIMPNHMHGILLIGRPCSTITTVGNGTNGNGTNGNGTNGDGTAMDRAAMDRAATRAAPTPNQGIDPVDHGDGAVGATLVVAPNNNPVAPNNVESTSNLPEIPFSKIQWATRPYLGQIVGAYTSIVATECLKHHKQNQPGVWLDKIWQRGFDERIIWDAKMFDNVSNYIINNPKNWKEDRFFD